MYTRTWFDLDSASRENGPEFSVGSVQPLTHVITNYVTISTAPRSYYTPT
jgi:hypothetical protein